MQPLLHLLAEAFHTNGVYVDRFVLWASTVGGRVPRAREFSAGGVSYDFRVEMFHEASRLRVLAANMAFGPPLLTQGVPVSRHDSDLLC